MQPMPQFNPYAPPTADPGGFGQPMQEGTYAWRHGDGVIVSKNLAVLPPRCVRCNQAEATRVSVTSQWHPPWVYVLLCLGAIPYVIGAMATRQQITIQVPLCQEHQSRRSLGMWLILLGIFGPLGAIFLAMAAENTLALALCPILFLALIPGLMLRNVLSPKRIDAFHAWFKAGDAFVASLPDGPYPFSG